VATGTGYYSADSSIKLAEIHFTCTAKNAPL